MERGLEIPVKLGRITDEEINFLISKNEDISGQKYLNYITAVGMICEFMPGENTRGLPKKELRQNLLLKTVNKVKEVYQEYF